GAQFFTSYVAPIHNSENFRDGRPFAFAAEQQGLRSAHISQAWWVTRNLLNVTTVGKFERDYYGAQNQTTFFVPGREDAVHVRLSRWRHDDKERDVEDRQNYSVSYQLKIQPWNLWVEPGYSRFVDGSDGPTLNVTRWFGDFNVQLHARRVEGSTFAGLRFAKPLTSRQ